jgi:hypothetical protein
MTRTPALLLPFLLLLAGPAPSPAELPVPFNLVARSLNWSVRAQAPQPTTNPEVLLPPEVRGGKGMPIMVVPIRVDGGRPKFKVGAGLQQLDLGALFPGTEPAGVLVYGATDGVFEVWAWNAKGDAVSQLSVCKVVVGSGIPVPPVPLPPGPVPPGPVPPDVKPDPSVIPIAGDGLHVLFVEETKDRAKLTREQLGVLFDGDMRDYLRSACPGEGLERRWYLLDKDIPAGELPKKWADALKRPRTSDFWMVVSNPAKGGWEGPLPADKATAKSIIEKYR